MNSEVFMRILFAAPEDAWGGFLDMIRTELPGHSYEATGRFEIDTLKGFDVLIPAMTKVTRQILEQGDRLRLVQQCGAGIEGVDLEAARDMDIYVANVPTETSGNADSVAELGVYMMIGLARDFRGMAENLGARNMSEPKGQALSGKTAGIMGLGGIGRALVKRLRPFDMRLAGIKRKDPRAAGRELGLDWAGGPDDLPHFLQMSDFVVLCMPVTQQTRHIMRKETLSMMKKGAFLINLSRGGLVDRDALEEALEKGVIAGAGLDVFWEEPPDPEDPIFRHNVLATPHIAGSTDISIKGIVAGVAENIRRLERNQEPLNLHYPDA
jgi:phosphoglycerate dehydrogenase-like enzyme